MIFGFQIQDSLSYIRNVFKFQPVKDIKTKSSIFGIPKNHAFLRNVKLSGKSTIVMVLLILLSPGFPLRL